MVEEFTKSSKLDQKAVSVMKELLIINSKLNSMIAAALQNTVSHTNRTTNAVLDYCIQSCKLVKAVKVEKEKASPPAQHFKPANQVPQLH